MKLSHGVMPHKTRVVAVALTPAEILMSYCVPWRLKPDHGALAGHVT
jgi:hypothetical protein